LSGEVEQRSDNGRSQGEAPGIAGDEEGRKMSIYYPLYEWLSGHSANSVFAPFKQIEAMLGFGLPPSARTTPQWWENDRKHVQGVAWIDAGFETRNLSLGKETVEFVRV
jgi:hypothetical protein